MHVLSPHDGKSALAAALQQLEYALVGTGESRASDVVEGVDAAAPWEALGHALPQLGLRGTWIEADVASVAARARPDLPLVGFVSLGVSEGWVLLDGVRGSRVHAWSSSVYLPNGWVRIEDLERILGRGPRPWARIEAAMPPAPLGGGFDGKPVQRLMRLLFAERESIGVVVIYAVAVGVLSLATPLAIQVLINWLAFGGLYQPILFLGGALLACLALAASLQAAQRYAVELIQRRLFARAVSQVGARLARVELSALDGVYGPELANRFFDVLTLQKATKTLLIDGLTAALQALVGLVLLAVYHPILLVFDLVVVALASLALIPLIRHGQDTAIQESKAKYGVAAWLEETARHPLVFKLGGGELAEGRLERESLRYLESRSRHFSTFFRQYVGMQAVQVLVQVGLLLTCGWLVLDGQLTLGQLVAAEFIVASALAGLTKFTDKLETVYDLLAGVDKLGALMDLPYEAPIGELPRKTGEGARIELRAVDFAWEGRRPVFRGADLEVPVGGRVAVLGAPGSGKSVLAELIAGLRAPDSGSVWRDGVPVSGLLREHVYADTLILRPGEIVQASVLDNLRLGRASIRRDDVWEALRQVGLHEVVGALPEGLDTSLGSGGAPLSESSARALLVARALLIRPSLLVLDGLLDGAASRGRAGLSSALRHLDRDTTLVALTEDVSVANRFDTVFEIRDGGVHGRPRLSTV